MKRQSQNDSILEHLLNGGSITNRTAIEKFDCYRLSARIKDLRKRGFNIETDMIYRKDEETGNYVKYAKYRLAV